jgi:hypothetical protein
MPVKIYGSNAKSYSTINSQAPDWGNLPQDVHAMHLHDPSTTIPHEAMAKPRIACQAMTYSTKDTADTTGAAKAL